MKKIAVSESVMVLSAIFELAVLKSCNDLVDLE